jgi:hypothetical protein
VRWYGLRVQAQMVVRGSWARVHGCC